MKTLIIYDNTGRIYLQISENYAVPQGGVQFIEAEVPDGKYVASVNVATKEPILADLPKTELELAKEQILATQALVAELQEQILSK